MTTSIDGQFDYVIAGAGSAGCVLAARLAEDRNVRVLVLEAGSARGSWMIDMPSALTMPMNSKRYNWGLETQPEPYLNGRRVNLPRGKGVGGSSLVNGMCYVRGNPLDYERWAYLGAEGWNWRHVSAYFKRAECVLGAQPGDPYRGTTGPLKVRRGDQENPLYGTFLEAGRQAGYALSDNMNQRQHEGFSPMEMTVFKGKRCSAARGYLKPAVETGQVKVLPNAMVDKVVIEDGRAKGVLFEHNGELKQVNASREVIVSAGSIMSPIILKRSGIGGGEELKSHGIEVVCDLPGVGENLMDHLELYLQQACTQPVSLYKWMGLLGKGYIGARWLATHTGLGATNHFESGAHVRSRAGIGYPDIQFHFLPLAISYDGSAMAQQEGYQVHVGTKRSKSRGHVRLGSAARQDMPKVTFNYMSHADDWQDMRTCIDLTREIFAQPAFAPYSGPELNPGADIQGDALDEFIRTNVESAYHPCGTCRMGTDRMAVVGPDCKVHGVEALRVVDASIMPQATAGDLNAPTIMLAEKASDAVRGRPILTDEQATIVVDRHWQTAQRSSAVDHNIINDPDAIAAVMEAETVGHAALGMDRIAAE
ncbi:MAG: choline dehydrogenase [Pseudomonadota bacterium]